MKYPWDPYKGMELKDVYKNGTEGQKAIMRLRSMPCKDPKFQTVTDKRNSEIDQIIAMFNGSVVKAESFEKPNNTANQDSSGVSVVSKVYSQNAQIIDLLDKMYGILEKVDTKLETIQENTKKTEEWAG